MCGLCHNSTINVEKNGDWCTFPMHMEKKPKAITDSYSLVSNTFFQDKSSI